jgi:glycine betaine/proline transport system permease protein
MLGTRGASEIFLSRLYLLAEFGKIGANKNGGDMAQSEALHRYRTTLTIGGTDYSMAATVGLGFALSLAVWALTRGSFGFPASVSERFDFVGAINGAEQWLKDHLRWATRAAANVVSAMLGGIEEFLWLKPWPVVVLAIVLPALRYGGLGLALFTFVGVMFWGMMDMWDPAMSTLALTGVSVLFSVVFGILTGILCAQSDRAEAIIKPILDAMQTMPAFVYLLPAIFFFGIGAPAAAMAIIIYAMPPAVRLTNLGIRHVSPNAIEAARSFGSTRWQLLTKVQLPLAKPSIMMGINQTIMMALGLAVLSVFIGAGGLGEEVWKALRKLKVGWALEGGLCIVFMAIIFDRLSLAMSRPASSGLAHDPRQMRFRLLPQRWVHWPPARVVETIIGGVWDAVAWTGNAYVSGLAVGLAALFRPLGHDRAEGMAAWLRAHAFLVVSLSLILGVLSWDAWVARIGFFPRDWQFTIRRPVDDAIAALTVHPGFIAFTKGTRAFIYLYILNPLDKFIVGLPWFWSLGALTLIAWRSAGIGFALVTFVSLLFCGAAGLWDLTMYTLAATLASVAVCIILGLPLGVLAAYSRPVDAVLRPILDAMQTMPAFVYLIPVLMFFGGNPVTAVIATVIYALPPMIRMTTLGLRQLPEEIGEVTQAFGSTRLQALVKVKLPMASPSIMLGVNQAVIMALAMQVITPLVSGLGLGKEVFHAMNTANTGRGLVAGVGIVLLAIVLDRLTQAWTRNQRKALGL